MQILSQRFRHECFQRLHTARFGGGLEVVIERISGEGIAPACQARFATSRPVAPKGSAITAQGQLRLPWVRRPPHLGPEGVPARERSDFLAEPAPGLA
jgi:hypothetical protein